MPEMLQLSSSKLQASSYSPRRKLVTAEGFSGCSPPEFSTPWVAVDQATASKNLPTSRPWRPFEPPPRSYGLLVTNLVSFLFPLRQFWLSNYLEVFQTHSPRLFSFYLYTLVNILTWGPWLVRQFANSVFASVTYNFGPHTTCFPHIDQANLAFGWCAITSLGDFNFRSGGHLVLWDLGLIIPFPPGTTILIPSALLRHSNTPVLPGERRYSITSYSPSGLFRWVSNGCLPDSHYKAMGKRSKQKQEWLRKKDFRWRRGLELLEVIA